LTIIRRLLVKAICQLGGIDERLTAIHTHNFDHQSFSAIMSYNVWELSALLVYSPLLPNY